MIETLEHSQMQQLAAVESYIMGMLSIDESDAHYYPILCKDQDIGNVYV